MKKKKITTIEDLAVLMQNEFLTMREEMDKGFSEIKQEIREIRSDIADLKLRMGETAHHFEFKELEKRVRRLEAKLAK